MYASKRHRPARGAFPVLEQGTEDLSGRFGDGSGRWQLWIHADTPMEVMGLGHADSGLLENLSRGRAGYRAWPLGTADLVVRSFSVDDTNPLAGDSLTLSATVRNVGDAPSATTCLRYYQSADLTISTADTEVGTDTVGELSASGTSPESVSLTVPSAAGTYYYGACVDPVADESNTTNNCSQGLALIAAEGPDLVVVSASVDVASPAPGGRFTFSATVANTGDTGSATTTLRYFRSTDSTISTADTEVGTDVVRTLSATDTDPRSVDLQAPRAAGTYRYGACVDAVADESDTTNNCSSPISVSVSTSNPYYGGHAVSPLAGCTDYAVGIVLDRDSAQEAVQAARQDCLDDGGDAFCNSSAVTFRHCVATFWGRGGDNDCYIGPSRRTTKADAEAAALATCRLNHPTFECTVVASACNSDF